MTIIAYCGLAVFSVLLVAHAVYESRRLILDRPLVVTPDRGEGRMVSLYPFDLLVCVNLPATEAETQAMIQEAMNRNVGWQLPENARHAGENVVEHFKHARAWKYYWRWQVTWVGAA